MAFKIGFLQYTTDKGEARNVFLAFGGINETWRSDENYISFDAFASADEYARGRQQIIETFQLHLSHEQVLEIFSRSGNVGNEISDMVWKYAQDTKFIADFSELDESGDRVMNLKSLNDLKATLAEV